MSNKIWNDELFADRSEAFDRQFNSVEKTVKRTFGAVLLLWFFGVLVSLAFTGVIIWAIIKLVLKFTA